MEIVLQDIGFRIIPDPSRVETHDMDDTPRSSRRNPDKPPLKRFSTIPEYFRVEEPIAIGYAAGMATEVTSQQFELHQKTQSISLGAIPEGETTARG